MWTTHDDNGLLADMDIEGWYLTNEDDVFAEIIDPSVNEPEQGDWATNITLWQAVLVGDTVHLHELDGVLKDNIRYESTWSELTDMVESYFGFKIGCMCGQAMEFILENLERE